MRLLSAVHPTTNQKRVLAKIIAAPTPTVASEEISKTSNLVAARNMLMKLGVVTLVDNQAALTDRGQQIASEENIVDQSGQLTSVGQQLAYTNSRNEPSSDQAGSAQEQPVSTTDVNSTLDSGDINLDASMPTESLQLLKQLLR